METYKAAAILERIEDLRSEMAACDTLAKLLETQMDICIGTDGRDATSFYLKLPVIRTAAAGLLKANHDALAEQFDELSKQVKGWQ